MGTREHQYILAAPATGGTNSLVNRALHGRLCWWNPISVHARQSDRRTGLAGPGRGSALDDGSSCTVHTPAAATAPELTGLLEAHRSECGVPGLLNVPMEIFPGYLAETPTDAVRIAFSSAVDLLAIGRFLISKDYWLLRGRAGSPTSDPTG